MLRLIELPWGDYVNPDYVTAVSVDRSGTGFVVRVSLDNGQDELVGPVWSDEILAKQGAKSVACHIAEERILQWPG